MFDSRWADFREGVETGFRREGTGNRGLSDCFAYPCSIEVFLPLGKNAEEAPESAVTLGGKRGTVARARGVCPRNRQTRPVCVLVCCCVCWRRNNEESAMRKVSKHMKRITVNPDICHGKPTIRNMRYPVESILELLSAGMTNDDILSDYPDLEMDDILACLAYASNITKVKSMHRLVS